MARGPDCIHGVMWDIQRGDLVRTRHKRYTTLDGNQQLVYYHGIVIGSPHVGQLTMFPEIEVYIFETRRVETFVAGQIETISSTYY